MNKWVKRKWLKALRSGEYGKGSGYLGWSGKYCCLGVLACELVPEFVHLNQENTIMDVDRSNNYLPDDLATLIGLSNGIQGTLADINDQSYTFDKVIDYIEREL